MTEKFDWSFVDDRQGKEEKVEHSETTPEEGGELKDLSEEIREQNYKKAKREMEKFIREHPTPDLAERLKKADAELRKRFGIK